MPKTKEEMDKEMKAIDEMVEEQFEETASTTDNLDETILSDSEKQWRKEVSAYPLLSEDEEKTLGTELKQKSGSLYYKSILFLDKVIPLLNKYPEGLKLSYRIYSAYSNTTSSSHAKEIDLIGRYISLRKKLNRPLTDEEIMKYFNGDITFYISKEEVNNEINNFIKYISARDKMIRSNLRLVGSIAGKYSYKTGVEFLDLVGEGSIGLIKAVEQYDVEYGFKLSTYATWWIRQSITRYLSKNLGDTKVPVNYYKEAKEFKEMVANLEAQNNKKYTVDELSKITGLERNTILDYLTYQKKAVSLDAPVGEEEETTLGDFLPGNSLNEDGIINPMAMKEGVNILLKSLTPEEKKVVCLYFGIGYEYPHGIIGTARELNWTKNRVEQVLQKAMNKMRHTARYQEKDKKLELLLK